MNKRVIRNFIFLISSFCYHLQGYAQNAGDLDQTFGVNGSTITDLGIGYDQCSGLVIQPDQKIVIAGRGYIDNGWYPTLIRMNTDGTLDNTFDSDGIAKGDVPHSTSFYAEADALALQPDGKFLYAFHLDFFGQDGLAVTRFNSDGSIDNDFGSNGTATQLVMTESNYSNSLLLQANGKILITGSGQAFDNAPSSMIAVRFDADGQLDQSFAENGIFVFNHGTNSRIYDAKQDGDGKIVMACSSSYSSYWDYVIVRLNEDGSFDETFGEAGIASFNISDSYDSPKFLTLREDGSVIVVGYAYSDDGSNMNMAMVSLTSGGVIDTAFGNEGIVVTPFGDGDDIAESVTIAPDGKILVAGYHEDFYFFGAVLRFNANGELDTSFGTDGIVLIDSYSYTIENIKVQGDGRIVVCGWTGFSGTNEHHFTASRLLYEGANSTNDTDMKENQISVFPNPASDFVSIQGITSRALITISDITGKIVLKEYVMQNASLVVSNLDMGIYMMTVFENGESSTKKMIVN